jgi:protein-tyrosine phosphatase
MKNVLFVCLGNICRSPMGEGILRYKAKQKGLRLKIDSAGTGHWHTGETPDKRAIKTAKDHGVDISQLVARQIVVEDFDKFDLILVADAEVYNGVLAIARNEHDKKKVEFIMNMVYPGSNKAVPDPYFGGMDGFEKVFDMLDKACESIILNLKVQ